MKINCYLLNNDGLVGSDVMILFRPGSYSVESYRVVCQGWPKTSFPSAGRKYDMRISRVASENSLFPTQIIDLYASIYGIQAKTN